ncbi:MAG: DUF433 domain-containing protein [Acidobacteria bacterium]|nr:DUF433 domain-containing protein [Acidobacteriota bacterium]
MSTFNDPVVHSDPEIMSGTPVFVGTRVPFQTLLDYFEAGQPLSEFLDDFPTVSKEQAVAALEQSPESSAWGPRRRRPPRRIAGARSTTSGRGGQDQSPRD